MLNSTRFASVILGTSVITASLICGAAAAQNAASSATSAASQGKHHGMVDMDTDKDGRLSRTEFAAAHGGKTDKFAGHDGNGDGFITQAEMDAHHAAMKTEHGDAPTMQQEAGKPHH